MAVPQLNIPIQWRAALANERPQRGYEYPEKLSDFFRSHYSGAAVYRWRIHPGQEGQREAVYVGEADNLAQRVQRVRTPAKTRKGGQTNLRLKKKFDEARRRGKHVFLDVADFEPFELNGALITRDYLDNKFKRCLMENLCICTLEKEGYELLNKRLEPTSTVERRFRALSPSKKRTALKAVENGKEPAAQD